MTILALHDGDGSIGGLIVAPDDAPPPAGLSDLPHRVSEIEGSADDFDFTRERDERRAIEMVRSMRVEVAPPARLVRSDQSS